MFDIAPSELLLVVIVAIVVIGPKDLPLALRTAGRWIGKMRRVSNHFRAGIETMIREAELADMEKKWQEQNAQIMAQSAAASAAETPHAATAEAPAHPVDPVLAPHAPTDPAPLPPPPEKLLPVESRGERPRGPQPADEGHAAVVPAVHPHTEPGQP
ncbi:Sec-independent protein translocase protein TatB [Novosphingobium capsulatum]|uniref:Sec-independent protein translocase protein TatB n=1 Tax=Novosphingobium capsulatum TaxID=13688 RepID=UPI0009FDBC95|nr:Sec-independent protein translocase protein TatB [Novosphingobium capsulatum]WQD92615.1 Sec-independent protein translocase protein TatB [Novosphingobium capsulatum]